MLIIDEAQHLRPEVLEQLRLLTNLETNKRKLLKVILIGQPELQELLRRRELRQLAQRITARYHLLPLTKQEVEQYVQHRLLIAGCIRPIFTKKALRAIHKLSGGVPRLINLMCDRALIAAYSRQQWQVEVKLLKAAAREVLGYGPEQRQQPIFWQILSSIAVLIGFVLIVWSLNPAKTKPEINNQQPWFEVASQSKSLNYAITELAAIWGVKQHKSDCQNISIYGLSCYQSNQDLKTLMRFEHPILLKLKDESGERFYATLAAHDGKKVILHVAGKQFKTSLEWLEQHYLNSAILLWQKPQNFHNSIGSASSPEQAQWLETQLSFLQGVPPRAISRFDAQLADKVRWFQMEKDLDADGIAGEQTLIQLAAAMKKIPSIYKREL